MSYTINLRKFEKLLKEVLYLRSELDYQSEVLRTAHSEFEHYYRQWCANNDIDVASLNKKHAVKIKEVLPLESYDFDDGETLITPAQMKAFTKANKLSKIYKQLAREIHPDKEGGDQKKFAKAAQAYNQGQWSIILEMASNLDIFPDNFSEVFPLMKEEIQDLKKQIGDNKKTYSWMLYECGDNNFCKDRLVRSFLNQLFGLGL